jgi:hypothetical protein
MGKTKYYAKTHIQSPNHEQPQAICGHFKAETIYPITEARNATCGNCSKRFEAYERQRQGLPSLWN